MSLRHYFVASALSGAMQRHRRDGYTDRATWATFVATEAIAVADAALAELSK
jgi:hypothetical protein